MKLSYVVCVMAMVLGFTVGCDSAGTTTVNAPAEEIPAPVISDE